MAHFMNQNRPGYGNAKYYECDKEVVRGPHDSYASEHRTQQYATPDYGRHNHNGGYIDRVSETENMRYQSNPDYGRHHHHNNGGAAKIIEKVEEVVYEKGYEPRRGY